MFNLVKRKYLFVKEIFSSTFKKNKTVMRNKVLFFLIFSVLFIASCVTGPNYNGYMQPVYVGPGIGLGTIIAVVISWGRNKSILWAIIHGLLGWLYVIYALLVKNT
jgi:hypothetical protein